MRFPVAYYLMILYLTVMLKPLLPFVNNSVSHFFAEAKHIATVHAKYGSHHLESEIASGTKNENSKNQNAVKSEETFPFHVSTTANNNTVFLSAIMASYSPLKQFMLPDIFLAQHAPPPKFILQYPQA